MIFRGVKVDEQVVDLVEHGLRSRVAAVDLVHHDDRDQAPLERLAQHESSLRQWPFGGVHEQHDAVHHRERSLDLAAEVRVARRVDDVDEMTVVVDGRVLRQNRDPPLALEVVRVHHAFRHALIGPEQAALPEQGVDKGGLAVVDVGDDGHVTNQGIGDRLWAHLVQ